MKRLVIQRARDRALLGVDDSWILHPIAAKWFQSVEDALEFGVRRFTTFGGNVPSDGLGVEFWVRELADDCLSTIGPER